MPTIAFDGSYSKREFFDAVQHNPDGSISGVGPVIIREEYAYAHDPTTGVLTDRTKTITWFNTDDTVAAKKVRPRAYNLADGLAEGKRWRANVVDRIQINVFGMILATTGWDIPTAMAAGAAFNLYAKAAAANYISVEDRQGLIDAITNADVATFTWIDNVIDPGPPVVTIRDYMLADIPP